MITASSRQRSGSHSARRVKKMTTKPRSRIPEILLTFLGIGIPASLALPLAMNNVLLKNEHQVALACGALPLGSFMLSLAMVLHERSCCYTSKVIFSWCLFSIITILCLLIVFLELTDVFAWGSTLMTEDRDEWGSRGFAVAGTLMLTSFLINWFYLCRCLGDDNRKRDIRTIKKNRKQLKMKINGIHKKRRNSSRRSSSRRSFSHSRPKRKKRERFDRQRSQSASAIVARVCENTGGGKKSMSHIVEMNSSWLDGNTRSRSRSRSRRSHARPLNLHSKSNRRAML